MKMKALFHRGGAMPLLIVLLARLPLPAACAETPEASVPVRVDPARMEGAIAGGLRWMAERQVTNGAYAGSWVVNSANYRPAVASLAGLAFLANGHLPGDNGPYGTNVAAALKYVMGAMAPDGYVGQSDKSGMYIHAISSLFALSCLGMQADERLEPALADWCRRSVDVILRAQLKAKAAGVQGGWRYDPDTADSDISVTCWQLLVLHTARQAGFEIEPSVCNSALSYLKRAYGEVPPAEAGAGGPEWGYFYPDRRVGGKAERSSTALVVFILSLYDAGDARDTRAALAYLRRYPPAWGGPQYGGFFYFSSFYMAQGMFQIGGSEWRHFGPRLATVLLDHQAGDGSWPYPSDNVEPATLRGTGPAYPAAMAVLLLSLEKQYLPMYQRQRRFFDGGTTVLPPVAEPVGKTADTPPEDAPRESAAPSDGGNADGGANAGTGGWDGEEEAPPTRPVGSPMFN
jgi:hypothetical protein